MKLSYFKRIILFGAFSILISYSCKREPYKPSFDLAGGTVVGKETCKADTSKDYWLIDLNINYTSENNFGDTLTINGVTYNHLVKTTQLLPEFMVIGTRVSFDCNFSSSKILTTDCNVQNPITYELKEMIVIRTFKVG
jgi:hypothetical protein